MQYKFDLQIRTPKILIPKPAQRIICTKIPGAQEYTPIKNACTCVNTKVSLHFAVPQYTMYI